jgi:hypothetical protein
VESRETRVRRRENGMFKGYVKESGEEWRKSALAGYNETTFPPRAGCAG